jgi:hypothetical protein
LLINLFCLQTQGLYPEAHIDVEVSSGEDDVSKTETLVGKKKTLACDDAKDGGVSSVELIAPNPISSGMPEQADPSANDWVATVVPPAGGRG